MPYSAKSIANAFLTLANRDGYDLDPMKLQKLIYYANGYYIAESEGEPLINEYMEAWDCISVERAPAAQNHCASTCRG